MVLFVPQKQYAYSILFVGDFDRSITVHLSQQLRGHNMAYSSILRFLYFGELIATPTCRPNLETPIPQRSRTFPCVGNPWRYHSNYHSSS